jgi:hypothetical protein
MLVYITVVNNQVHATPLMHIDTREIAFQSVKSVLLFWKWRMQISEATNKVSQLHALTNLPPTSPKFYHHHHWSPQPDSTLNNINCAPSLTIQLPRAHFSITIHLSHKCLPPKKKKPWKYSSSYLHAHCLLRWHECFVLQHKMSDTKELPSLCIFSIP